MGRIRYGLKNIHVATYTEDEATGKLTYGEVKELKGAKNMSFSAAGDSSDEYADDGQWAHFDNNNGYTGSIEFEDTASLDDFMTDIYGYTKAENGLTVETSNDVVKGFALLGQFTLAGGKEVGKRVCFYKCVATRPDVAGQTKESGITVNTNTLNITAMPRVNDGAIKSTAVSTDAIYDKFFDAVPEANTSTTGA